jgi:2-keto-4-pentenoate hydratase
VQAGLQQRAAAAARAEVQARDLRVPDAGAAQGVVVDLHQSAQGRFFRPRAGLVERAMHPHRDDVQVDAAPL